MGSAAESTLGLAVSSTSQLVTGCGISGCNDPVGEAGGPAVRRHLMAILIEAHEHILIHRPSPRRQREDSEEEALRPVISSRRD
jgi:hypothetical protein